jgi:uncharacterized membrane protein
MLGRSASSARNPAEEQRRAASAYLVWPLALANIVREGGAESIWIRLHARQALVFGLLASVLFLFILALPVVTIVMVPTISTDATIAVYSAGLIVDVIAGILFAMLTFHFSARSARGELFAIPLVTPIVDAVFRLRPP